MGLFGPRREVRLAVDAWLAAVAARAEESACAIMVEAARAQLIERLSARDCPEAIRRIADALGLQGRDELRRVTARKVRFRGPELAVVTLGAGPWELEMRRVQGRWIVGDLMSTVRIGTGGAYPPMPSSLGSAPSPPAGIG
jgi:hypothetical protein